jgi:hypothetical protein
MHKIQRVQDLLATKNRESATISESLEYVVNQALQKLDPIEKAKRASKRAADRRANSKSNRTSDAEDSSTSEKSESSVKDSGRVGNSCSPQKSCVTGPFYYPHLESFSMNQNIC